jgi:Uma2 family endonuclease
MSLEEFAALPDEPGKQELDGGELVKMAPVYFLHSRVQHTIRDSLRDYLLGRDLGEALLETSFVLTVEPPTVRIPDIAYVSKEKLADAPAEAFLKGAPDIAIEVVSPSESASDLELKVRQYLATGSQAVATVFPRTRTVWIYGPGAEARRLEGDDALSFPGILGDWSLPLGEIFPAQAG